MQNMILASIIIVTSALLGFYLNRFHSLKIFNDFTPYYDKSKLEFTGKIIVTFNLISVFIALISAYRLTKQSRRV